MFLYLKEISHAIAIKLGFIVDPTVSADYRLRKKKINFFIFLLLLLHLIFSPYVWGTSCLIQGSIGVPCPTCGSVRSVICLLKGNLKQALYWHPLVFLSLFVLIGGFSFSIAEEVRKQRAFAKREIYHPKYASKTFWLIFLPVLLLYLIVFIVRLINLYPEPPMNYNNFSVLGRIIRFLKMLLNKKYF